MSIVKELLGIIKSIIGLEEGQTIPKFLVKAGIKQATKLTPNLSKTILYGKKATRSDLSNAFVKLLTSNDEIGKKFRVSFSEALKILNLKTNLLIEEKIKIAEELGKQEEHNVDEVSKLSAVQANEIVEEMIDTTVIETENKE